MAFGRTILAGLAVFGAGLGAGPALAGPFTADYVFGDSLSDRGNLAEAVGNHFPSPPFVHDSFTNGPTAVQVMAQRLGLTEDPSLFVTGFQDIHGLGYTSGTNYAVAGATAGNIVVNAQTEGVTGANLASQVGAYLLRSGGATDSSALYTVFIGGNDVRTAAHRSNSAYVTAGVQAELDAVNQLIKAGAQNLLVVNVPDVGAIPEFKIGYPTQDADATNYSIQYDAALAVGVTGIQAANPGLNIKLFDDFAFNNNLNLASLGITDTTDPCYTGYSLTGTPASTTTSAACGPIDPATGQAVNIGSFEFWDSIHPTAKLQQAVGDALYATEVPEPASLALLGAAVAGLAAVRRRRTGTRA